MVRDLLELTECITDDVMRVQARVAVMSHAVATGSSSVELFNCVAADVMALTSPGARDTSLANLMIVASKVHGEVALGHLDVVSSRSVRDYVVSECAAQVAGVDVARALSLVGEVASVWFRSSGLREIARVVAEHDVRRSQEIIAAIPLGSIRDRAYGDLVQRLVSVSQWPENAQDVDEILALITDGVYRGKVRIGLAGAIAPHDVSAAVKIFYQGLDTILDSNPEFDLYETSELLDPVTTSRIIIEICARDVHLGWSVATSFVSKFLTPGSGCEYMLYAVIRYIARTDPDFAMRSVSFYEDQRFYSTLMAHVAVELFLSGDPRADETLHEAIQLATKMRPSVIDWNNHYFETDLLLRVGAVIAQVRPERAMEIITQVFTRESELLVRMEAAPAVCELLKGDVTQGLNFIESIPNPGFITELIVQVVGVLAGYDYQAALRMARSYDLDPGQMSCALGYIVQAVAPSNLTEALAIAALIDHPYQRNQLCVRAFNSLPA